MSFTYKCVVYIHNKKQILFEQAESDSELISKYSEGDKTLVSYKIVSSVAKICKKPVHKRNTIIFTETLSTLLNSGLSVTEALDVAERINKNKQLSLLCMDLKKSLEKGSHLYESLLPYKSSFSDLYIDLIKIGELSGAVKEIFAKLTSYLKIKRDIRQKLIQSLTYPLIILFTAILVVITMIVFVYPKLKIVFDVFLENSQKLSHNIEQLYGSITIVLVCLSLMFVTSLLLILCYFTFEKMSFYIDKLLLKIPYVGALVKTCCCDDFTFATELLTGSGMSVVKAMQTAATIVFNREFKNCIQTVCDDISEGEAIAFAFSKHKCFPDYFVTWIGIGEATGCVENTFHQIHDYYSKEKLNIITSLLTEAEPVFILLTGIMIFILVFNFVLPIFSLLGEL